MESSKTLRPGKIWYGSEENRRHIARMRFALVPLSVQLYGRFGRWEPKYLTSDVWKDSASLEALPWGRKA
jgi:hypothetical protein